MFNYGFVYFILIFLFFLIGIKIKENHINIYFVLMDFLVSTMSFFIQPVSFYYTDMERFNGLLSTSRTMNELYGFFSGFDWLSVSSEYVGQPLVCAYIWLLSFFKYNNWFFAITTFIFIGCFFIVIRLLQNKFKYSNVSLISASSLFFLYFNLFFEIEGIRNFLAFIMIVLGFCYDIYYGKKFFSIFIYILAILMHPSAIMIVAIIFGLKVIQYIKINSNISLIKIFGLILLFSNYIILFISKILPPSQGGFLQVIQGKSDGYVSGNSTFQAYASGTEILVTSILFVFLIFSVFCAYRIGKKNGILDIKNTNYFNFIFLLISFNIGSFQSTQIYLRVVILILFLTLPLLSCILSNNNSRFFNFVYILLILAVALITSYYWYVVSYGHLFINFSNLIQ